MELRVLPAGAPFGSGSGPWSCAASIILAGFLLAMTAVIPSPVLGTAPRGAMCWVLFPAERV